MHKNTIHTSKAMFYINNTTGATHARLYATGREYQTYKNARNALFIKIKGMRYYFIKANGAPLCYYDFDIGCYV